MGPQCNNHRLYVKGLTSSDVKVNVQENDGDPWGNRTPVTGVRGRCLNRLTNGPKGSPQMWDLFKTPFGDFEHLLVQEKTSCTSFGAPSGTRTRGPLIKSQLLYHLS